MAPKSLLIAAPAVLLTVGLVYCSSATRSLVETVVRLFDNSTSNYTYVHSFPSLRSRENLADNDRAILSSVPLAANFESDSNSDVRITNQQYRRRLTEIDDDFIAKSLERHLPLFEPSDTYSINGPTVFPKPSWLYETDDIKDDDIVTYLQPTSGQHRPDQDSVLLFAAEYGFDTYLLFLMTLYETGYKGDVVVGISRMDWEDKKIREFLEHWENKNGENQMTVVVYVVPYHCYNLEGDILPSHRGGMRVCQCHNMFGQKNKITGEVTPFLDKRHGRTAQTIRYELYWIWSEHYNPNNWMLLIDARDTIFQTPPFERVPRRTTASKKSKDDNDGGMLIFFAENADATSLGKSKYNRRWLTLAYGQWVADAFASKPTICSGSTMGEQSAIDAYLRAEVSESDESKTVIFGADQGFHNYLYYSNKLGNAKAISKILVQDQGLGLVNNMGALRDKKLHEWGNGRMVEKTDSEFTVYNWDGTVSPIVHQYDRHKELSQWWMKKKLGEFKSQWNTLKQK